MIRIGLTGSIGMGKSATAAMFAEAGASVWSADDAVHRLYAPGGQAVSQVAARFPGVTSSSGGIGREALAGRLASESTGLPDLEAIVFPLVAADRNTFLRDAENRGAALAILEIPLLFETGAEGHLDAVVVVTAPPAVQRRRVLLRPDMTSEKFALLSARQLPDEEKRVRADYIVDTSRGFEAARAQVRAIVAEVSAANHRHGRELQ